MVALAVYDTSLSMYFAVTVNGEYFTVKLVAAKPLSISTVSGDTTPFWAVKSTLS